jgi:hypothetical protein
MSGIEIIAIVSSFVTIVAFIFSVWQHIRLKAADQALRSVRNIVQAALVESFELQKVAQSEEERARHRVSAAFFTSILNACLTFLNVSREQVSRPSADEQAFFHMGSGTEDAETGAASSQRPSVRHRPTTAHETPK